MKKFKYSDFQKLPTSDREESEKLNKKKKLKNKYKNKKENLFNNLWIIIIFIIICIISIFFVFIKLLRYILELKNNNNNNDIKTANAELTIIINTFNKTNNLDILLESLINQTFSSYDIIATKNDKTNFNEDIFSKFSNKNIAFKIIQFNENKTNLKMRIDSAALAKGDYILFLNSDDYFPGNILYDCWNILMKEKVDIIQYNYFHDDVSFNKTVFQPELFDSMFYGKDAIYQKQFHLTGKIIKKKLFLNAMKDIDKFYFENYNNKIFEESMIVFKLFKKAESLLKLESNEVKPKCVKVSCPKNSIPSNSFSKNDINQILMYVKFLFQYTDNKALEKRMASKLFIELLAGKSQTRYHYDNNLLELLDEIINLYSNCDSINEYDIRRIKNYRNNIEINAK